MCISSNLLLTYIVQEDVLRNQQQVATRPAHNRSRSFRHRPLQKRDFPKNLATFQADHFKLFPHQLPIHLVTQTALHRHHPSYDHINAIANIVLTKHRLIVVVLPVHQIPHDMEVVASGFRFEFAEKLELQKVTVYHFRLRVAPVNVVFHRIYEFLKHR